jgi:hypothetical protein
MNNEIREVSREEPLKDTQHTTKLIAARDGKNDLNADAALIHECCCRALRQL